MLTRWKTTSHKIIYVLFFLAIDTSDEGSSEIIETFSVTPKMVKISNITRMIFRLDLYDLMCISSISTFARERWQTSLPVFLSWCTVQGFCNVIAMLLIALNFDSFQWTDKIHKVFFFQNRWLKRNTKGSYLLSNILLGYF